MLVVLRVGSRDLQVPMKHSQQLLHDFNFVPAVEITTYHYQKYYINSQVWTVISLFDWSLEEIGFNPKIKNSKTSRLKNNINLDPMCSVEGKWNKSYLALINRQNTVLHI